MPGAVAFVPDIVLQVIGDEALLLNLSAEVVFSLNSSGARVAALIAAGDSLDAIVDRLAGEYGTTRDQIRPGVDDLVEVLLARGLVRAVPPVRTE